LKNKNKGLLNEAFFVANIEFVKIFFEKIFCSIIFILLKNLEGEK